MPSYCLFCFFRSSSISLHCSPIQFSFAFFMHLLMLLFTSLYFSEPSGSNHFFLGSLLLLHRSRISAVTQDFFLLTMFAKDFTSYFRHCCVEGGGHWIHVCIFIIHDGKSCKIPVYHRFEGSQHIGIFQLFGVNLEYLCALACWFFSGEGGRLSLARRSLPMSAPGKLRVLALFTSDRKHFLTRM